MSALSKEEIDKFESKYQKYSSKLYRIAFLILCNSQEAEDIVQDVYIKYFNKQPVFLNDNHEEGWFVSVTVNLCKDNLKKSKRNVYIENEQLEQYGISDKQADTLGVISTLPEKYKSVILLHYMEGYTIEEISKLLSISISSVKMRLVRGREKFKSLLQEGEEYCAR